MPRPVTMPEGVAYVGMRENLPQRVFSKAEVAAEWISARYHPGTLRRIKPDEDASQTTPRRVADDLANGFLVFATTGNGQPISVIAKTIWEE